MGPTSTQAQRAESMQSGGRIEFIRTKIKGQGVLFNMLNCKGSYKGVTVESGAWSFKTYNDTKKEEHDGTSRSMLSPRGSFKSPYISYI